MKIRALAIGILMTACVSAWSAPEELTKERAQQIADGLKYQHGTVVLKNGLATLTLPDNLAFLDAAGARTVLSTLWGNPPSDEALGLIVPTGFSPFSTSSWAVEITYDESGYVSDKDANTINYTSLLKQMQEGVREVNPERVKEGYPEIQLIGWAAPPRYDAASHKFYWAKELQFGSDEDHTLNYSIRVLGRRGVLVLNAIASMKDLPQIEKDIPEIISAVNFDEGHRYADFNPSVDKVAGYGLAALVAGGVAAKAGLFKGLIAVLIAGKKFVIAGAIALFAFLSRFFKRKA